MEGRKYSDNGGRREKRKVGGIDETSMNKKERTEKKGGKNGRERNDWTNDESKR